MITTLLSDIDFDKIPLGFDNGQTKLTEQNIKRILTFSGAPLAFLSCSEGQGHNTAVLYEDGQIFIIPVNTAYFLDCIGRYLDFNMAKHRQTTAAMVEKSSNNIVYLGAGLQYLPLKVAAPWVSSKHFSYINWQSVFKGHCPRKKCLVTPLGIVISYTQRSGKVKEKLEEGKKTRDSFIERCWIVYDVWLYCDACSFREFCIKFLDKQKKDVDG